MKRLEGRCALVTGASGGIGRALCAQLVAAGASVIAVARTPPPPPGSGTRWRSVSADLATEGGRERVMRAVAEAACAPDVLVLGHAIGEFGRFEDQPPERIAEILQVNLVSSALLVRALLPHLQRLPRAAVVAIGSTFGSIGFAGFGAYSASKFGLRGLFEALSREYADSGVRFQYVSPRATRTAFNPPAVEALNQALGAASDPPEVVARAVLDAIARGTSRRQLGWPEKLFARINGVLPELVDRSLRKQLPVILRHAEGQAPTTNKGVAHARSSS